ncbi:uncharacterized protein LOC128879008 [Hylaeus volcanicus]|uniref:uncharacterized protein LOC128879008 n=1 Tax=Hylaeus volcanicus TaxID=313075 RepID=UPI0023B7E89C|nr:uncharacterized protein LOC128879008 [Hylaeus volcanicus]XP_053983757.1 uncharacterized protein LOC128879008 [Hylaeus volcanicus]XP_053983766.1 uncharacterized protein LOC128879008 [Hylaeus volcanicus]
MKLLVVLTLVALAAGHPGLLRIPKVYNAVITSNQNLSPSRAFPVIQPVIHRTAIGYVPPLYYAQVAPHVSGPELVHYPRTGTKSGSETETVETELSTAAEYSKLAENKGEEEAARRGSEKDQGEPRSGLRNKQEEQQPLSFYPNYHSLHYDPYFYTYNGINPHLVPGTYYVDYQPYGTLEPIPASTPNNGLSGHLLPGYHEEKKDAAKAEKEKVPDVPPPPLPTAVPKDP